MKNTIPTPLIDFRDAATEQSLLAHIAINPSIRDMPVFQSHDLFIEHVAEWGQLQADLANETLISLPCTWISKGKPDEEIKILLELEQKRALNDCLLKVSKGLEANSSIEDLTRTMMNEAASIQTSLHAGSTTNHFWAVDMLPEIMADVDERYARQEAGAPILGIKTGVPRLDSALNGLNTGFYIISGKPGVGKTTFCWQIADNAADQVPVIYLTFENSPQNLLLKSICALNEIDPKDVQNGFRESKDLRKGIHAPWLKRMTKVAIVDGSDGVTVESVKSLAIDAMLLHDSNRCLIVVDYLQLWAKTSKQLRQFQIRERVELLGAELIGLSKLLKSPVIALSSQNRSGYAKEGEPPPGLESLKESGDLEYGADAVMILTEKITKGRKDEKFRTINLSLLKNRHGERTDFDLIFDAMAGTMIEIPEAGPYDAY